LWRASFGPLRADMTCVMSDPRFSSFSSFDPVDLFGPAKDGAFRTAQEPKRCKGINGPTGSPVRSRGNERPFRVTAKLRSCADQLCGRAPGRDGLSPRATAPRGRPSRGSGSLSSPSR
jgi:hypothetical protein